MKARLNLGIFLMIISLTLTGCSSSFNPAVVITAKSELREGSEQKPITETYTEAEQETSLQEFQTQKITEVPAAANYVGIKAHIKEVHGDQLLISSDSDDFPGVFWILGGKELADSNELSGGSSVFILMEDLKEKKDDGIEKYRAEQFFVLPEEEDRMAEDILLTDVPTFALTDALSSKYESFEIRAGNYMWNSEENGEGSGVVACGSAPLEEAASQHCARLKLPEYNGIDYVGYVFSTKIQPDKLVVRQWSKGISSSEAMEESVTTYYYVIPFLTLKPNKVYEFIAEWKEENQEQRKFSGSANYVLVTE